MALYPVHIAMVTGINKTWETCVHPRHFLLPVAHIYPLALMKQISKTIEVKRSLNILKGNKEERGNQTPCTGKLLKTSSLLYISECIIYNVHGFILVIKIAVHFRIFRKHTHFMVQIYLPHALTC